jgi:ferredoxin
MGMCEAAAPGYFHFVGGRSEPVSTVVEQDDDLELVLTAAELCPAAAISVRGVTTGQRAQLTD